MSPWDKVLEVCDMVEDRVRRERFSWWQSADDARQECYLELWRAAQRPARDWRGYAWVTCKFVVRDYKRRTPRPMASIEWLSPDPLLTRDALPTSTGVVTWGRRCVDCRRALVTSNEARRHKVDTRYESQIRWSDPPTCQTCAKRVLRAS